MCCTLYFVEGTDWICSLVIDILVGGSERDLATQLATGILAGTAAHD